MLMKDVKVVFMGTPDFSVPVLEMLIEETNVVLVVTQPDKEVGRKRELRPSPVKEVALKNNIAVFQPEKIRKDFELIKEIKPDLIVTCAYGQILPQELLDMPTLGAVNVHASLLPKYRGSAPIQWVLLNGEEETGITLMYMDAGMDTGDMIAKSVYKIKDSDNVGTLHDILSVMGANLLKDNLENIVEGRAKRLKQNDEDATLAPMIKREDEQIDINEDGVKIVNKIRALSPWPLAYIRIKEEEFKVIKARFEEKSNYEIGKVEVEKNSLGIHVKNGVLYLEVIKPLGKKEMDIKSYLNGISKERLVNDEVR